jgi:hypothetical protein
VQTWRNLGDTVISLDEHTLYAPEGDWRNTYAYLEDRQYYATRPAQERYRYQIRNAIPWYLSFYTSWRANRARLFMRYEWMAIDPQAYFHYLIGRLERDVDVARLRRIVSYGPSERSGFNVGIVGRSRSMLDSRGQEMLEACIREHPSDVRELLYELPWYADKHGPPTTVSTENGETYLVAQGVRHRASEHWLVTHQVDRATAAQIPSAEVQQFPSGADLF